MAKATTKKVPTTKRPSPGQKYIEGAEPLRIKELDDKALEYRKLRDKRQKLLSEEIGCKAELLEMMHTHKLTTYAVIDADVDVVLEPGEECVKVRKRKSADEGFLED